MEAEFKPPHFDAYKDHLGKYPTVFLVRHGKRPTLPKDVQLSEATRGIGLTDEGKIEAELCGKLFRETLPVMDLRLVISSPSLRCKQTAQLFATGAGFPNHNLQIGNILGGEDLMSKEAKQKIIAEDPALMEMAMRGEYSIGDKSVGEAGEHLLRFITQAMNEDMATISRNWFGVAVSHDAFIALLLAKYFGITENILRPEMLEGILIQRIGGTCYRIVWRGESTTVKF